MKGERTKLRQRVLGQEDERFRVASLSLRAFSASASMIMKTRECQLSTQRPQADDQA